MKGVCEDNLLSCSAHSECGAFVNIELHLPEAFPLG